MQQKSCVICSKPATRYLLAVCVGKTFDFKDSPVCDDSCLVTQVKELTNSGFLPQACKAQVVDL